MASATTSTPSTTTSTSTSITTSTTTSTTTTSTMPTSPNEPLGEWRFQQVFGDKGLSEDANEADIISAVEFDPSGDYLAIGDRGGRVVILERNSAKKSQKRSDMEFKVMTEFQSHEPEFDYLKSLEIEEKINQIRWCKRNNSAHLLLTTNDKTIKLWKVYEKKLKSICNTNFNGESPVSANSPISLRIPKVTLGDTVMAHTPRRIYANAHAYHINSISPNSDGETYISADDLRVNLWNLSVNNQSFNIVDIKPENMEDLTEVITSASFHPNHCSLFMYSSSKGTIKLIDMRDAALCNKYSKVFEAEEDAASKTFFSEIISSISDAKFSRDGRYIISRDYMTLKLWDMNMESRPVKVFNVHEALRSRLVDLYENDCIFDKFECGFSGDANHVITGSYKNNFHIFDRQGKQHTCVEASRTPSKSKTDKKQSSKSKLLRKAPSMTGKKKDESETFETTDFSKKVLHLTWHPTENVIAVAAVNNLYIFTNPGSGPSA